MSSNPGSGTALTDANGVAAIIIKPIAADTAGATSIDATVVVGGKTATTSANLAVGAAALTVGTLSFTGTVPAKLPAFSSLQLNIPVSNGGQPSSVVTGLTVSSLCLGDKGATIVLGPLVNGVQTATYTNTGCARGTDTITAQIGTSVQTISVGVDVANIGAIQFVSSDIQGSSIVIKGSGGLGRAESALLTFRVLDQNNQGLAGVDVDFTASTNTGGLTVAPARATTDATGRVTTTVNSGTIPTPVRVFAQAVRNGKTITGLSDTLTISTGLPIQKNLSLSADKYNIEGGDYDGVVSNLTVRMADQYGNPISDGTAVSFITEGGAVGNSKLGACVTADGGCSVELRSQNFRPANGRVTVLAYVQGLENFVDSNGDGQYSCTNFRGPDGVSIPAVYRPLIDTCVSGGEPFTDQGDPFLDAGLLGSVVSSPFGSGTLDGTYNAENGDLPVPYSGTTYAPSGNNRWGLNYLSRSAEFIFSGSAAYGSRVSCNGVTCTDFAPPPLGQAITVTTTTSAPGVTPLACAPVSVQVRLYDRHNNPLPYDSAITVQDADKVTLTTISPDKVLNSTDVGGTVHSFNVKPDATCVPGSFALKIVTPKGNTSLVQFKTN